jgi:hypothetical protein
VRAFPSQLGQHSTYSTYWHRFLAATTTGSKRQFLFFFFTLNFSSPDNVSGILSFSAGRFYFFHPILVPLSAIIQLYLLTESL